jgi:K+-transporting ATPase KdpF subunit
MKGRGMAILTGLTAVVTVLLLVYLFAALVRPEWF